MAISELSLWDHMTTAGFIQKISQDTVFEFNILCYALWQIAYLSQEESTATALPRDLTAA